MNKLLRRTIIFVGVLLLASLLAVWQPWKVILSVPGITSGTALTVNTQSGKAEVYIDEQKVGETPFQTENLTHGEHDLRIVRLSNQESFYETISKQIFIEEGTRTFVEAEIGPGRQFTSLKIVYYRKDNPGESRVYVDTSPEKSTVTIDDNSYGQAPLTTSDIEPGRHTILVSHDGYETEETTIIVREGYTLIAEFQLMAKPIELPQQ